MALAATASLLYAFLPTIMCLHNQYFVNISKLGAVGGEETH